MRSPPYFAAAAFVTALGCGRIGFEPSDRDALDALDAFGTPMRVDELRSGFADDDPTLTADQLELYWESTRPGGVGNGSVWRATRATTAEPFSALSLVAELDSPNSDGSPGITGDGLVLVFVSDRAGSLGNTDLYLTQRDSREAPWAPPIHLAAASSSVRESGAALSDDGLELWFHSDRASGIGLRDLYIATRATRADAFGPATLVPELSTAGDEGSPCPWHDTHLYFESSRPGGAGLNDLWVTHRSAPNAPYAPAVPLAELNSSSDDLDPWLSDDGRTIYFASNRAGASDLYRATR